MKQAEQQVPKSSILSRVTEKTGGPKVGKSGGKCAAPNGVGCGVGRFTGGDLCSADLLAQDPPPVCRARAADTYPQAKTPHRSLFLKKPQIFVRNSKCSQKCL